jgi:hypothetical protein
MKQKFCPRCKTEQSVTEFGSNKNRKDGLQSYCKNCRSSYNKIWVSNNHEAHYARVKKNTTRIARTVHDILRSSSCVDCGETRTACLQFDHVDPTQKSFNVSTAPYQIGSLQRILDEIDKCVVRCANCHAVRTAEQFGWYHKFNIVAG